MAGAVAVEAGEDRARTDSRTPAVILLTEWHPDSRGFRVFIVFNRDGDRQGERRIDERRWVE